MQIGSGLILLLGNDLSPMNYADNAYPFRQDSSFLYFFGLDEPGLAAIIDIDRGIEQVFGDDLTVEQIVWTGPQPPLREKCEQIGVTETAPSAELGTVVQTALKQERRIHFLPQYRPENILKIRRLLGIEPETIQRHVSESLIRAVVEQRSVKSPEEVAEIEAALDVTYEMQTAAMKMARPDVVEREVAGAMEGIALAHGVRLSFPTIFSVHGETLHNPYHDNTMKAGDIAVNDCGAESLLHYAGDITRTIPIGGRFSQRQKDIYTIVLDAQEKAIAAVRPGIEFRQVHRLAGVALLAGLKELGLVKGDPEEAVEADVHTLFLPCGVGHMLGLDIHDMDALGEDYVGYTDTIRRNPDFGWRSLRLARAVEPSFIVTVEPGIYFIPALIDRWHAEGKHESFVDYAALESYRDFGGVRLEDDVLVTTDAPRVLGKPIPKAIEDVEALASA
jgi:Xaa-Pro aminopeptidase